MKFDAVCFLSYNGSQRCPALKMKSCLMLLGIVPFLLVPRSAAGQQAEAEKDIFLAHQQAVMLVSQSVHLERTRVRNLVLFKSLEWALGRNVLDQYFPLVYGTAFAVSPDGYLVTAFHIIKHVPEQKQPDWSLRSFTQYLGRHLVPGYLRKSELNTIFKEYRSITRKSDLFIIVKTAGGEEYRAEVVAKDDQLDLALLRINPLRELATIPFTRETTLRANQKVVTIGYPLQNILDQFLDDLKSSITDGIISAVREDRWDIQHTASLNPGNSGGPLLNAQGELVGINVGEIKEANNICFAVRSQKLIDWLRSIDKGQLIKEQ
jgi:S1-C subfamily serine protease